jgi:phage terminase Nu1 subunit (DNA packaging protein)
MKQQMSETDLIEEQVIATVTNWSGLPLSDDRVKGLIPAGRRLRQAAQWLSERDLDATEPACVFDPRIAE